MIRRLWPFVLGSVALGLDAYVIAGLLPAIAASLGSRVETVGLGVATFTGAYALSGPILAGRAGRRPHRSLLISVGLFTVANIATAASGNVWVFLAARGLAGGAAGVYSPLSTAVAAGLVEPRMRGRALALVLSGLAVGTVFGVPLGLLLAGRWGWRVAILLIVVVGAVGLIGIAARGGELPEVPASGVRDRLRVLGRPDNLLTVTVVLLTGIASLGLYTYLTVILGASRLASHQTLAIWVWGIGGAIGALGIGHVVDRRNPLRVSVVVLAALACALAGMTLVGSPTILVVSLFVWGMCGWASLAPQQHILLEANPSDGATAMAASASANYLGSAIGAGLGAILVASAVRPSSLGFWAAGVAVVALVGQIVRSRMGEHRRPRTPDHEWKAGKELH